MIELYTDNFQAEFDPDEDQIEIRLDDWTVGTLTISRKDLGELVSLLSVMEDRLDEDEPRGEGDSFTAD